MEIDIETLTKTLDSIRESENVGERSTALADVKEMFDSLINENKETKEHNLSLLKEQETLTNKNRELFKRVTAGKDFEKEQDKEKEINGVTYKKGFEPFKF